MKIKKLVAFGCSWTYGDELEDPSLSHMRNHMDWDKNNNSYRLANSYPGLIAKHYNLELDNCAWPGASLHSMRDTLLWYVQTQDISNAIFLVGLTNPVRMSWYNACHELTDEDPAWNQHVHSTWLKNDSNIFSNDWKTISKLFYQHQDCEEFRIKNLIETLLLFDGVAARYHIPTVQFDMFECYDHKLNIPTHARFASSIQSMLYNQTQSVLAPNRHPNEKGHQYIADLLINYIDSAKILE